MRLFGQTALCFIIVVLVPSAAHAQLEGVLTPAQRLWSDIVEAEKNKDYDSAIENVKKVMEITGNSPNAYANLHLGWLCYLKKDYGQAEAAYQAAAKNAPAAVSPLYGLINCHVATKNTDAAIEVAESLLDIDPLNYIGNKQLGDLYYQKKDYKSSGIYYYKLATTYPEDLEMANSLAWCYLKMGRMDMAKTIFSNIMAVLPHHESANFGYQQATKKAAADEE
jgi:tetratricopeptide (TPR) repeat protein